MARGPKSLSDGGCPANIGEYADQAVEYVRRSLGVTLEFNSETLPVLDHYLREASDGQPSAVALVAATSGAYFGEVIRRRLGGYWHVDDDDPTEWRFELPGGLCFRPVCFALAAIFFSDEYDDNLTAPPKMLEAAEAALERMGHVSPDTYYSLCGRLDTLEHLQSVLLAIAAREAQKKKRSIN
jgi:hypothetical protein